ncbi:MAG: Lrp/AsnC family transcriptional regulator [Alphaproteobacteria bacterium]|jgi:Lrp/AsnC family transcriptional regulator, leucine-responsive regulatory protein|nr:Lrp/AsnC family transcriptional regulator [Alphaproteobacteria bacterium]MBT4017330.1 Lrp/AsnC family transcriptional regulator [Alphaproteobacteria bacterium]MBT7746940.1 Lrp/AsnC family transcriptional regulator [Alphaproteobacteria bacterium]
MTQQSLDQTDKRILEILQKDSSLSNAELAERVNLSSSSCHRRVRLLEQSGLIDRYVALLSHEALGLTLTVFIEVALNKKDKETRDSFMERIRLWPEVLECHFISGEYDNLLRIVLEDIVAYRKFVLDKLLAIPEVEKTRSSISLGQWKSTTALPLGSA